MSAEERAARGDVVPVRRVNKRQEKDDRARLRECLAEERLHVRVGKWRGFELDQHVELVGMAADLHGTVCTCCPKRRELLEDDLADDAEEGTA